MNNGMNRDLGILEERIGYRFRDRQLLKEALRHSSYLNEHPEEDLPCNERAEFLGDAVLETAASDILFRTYPKKNEGELTKHRAELVCEASLAYDAARFGLASFLEMGKGEELTGGRERESIVSDALEALIGAVYLDGGMDEAMRFIRRFILDDLEGNRRFSDCKTRLQEFAQETDETVCYRLVREEGPPHAKRFSMEVLVGGKILGAGTGPSKKAAEQAAARQALEKYKEGNLTACT